jgi:hypothetical protein
MRKFLCSLIAGLSLAMLVPAARAQSITFYDTMSGPSWLP